MKLFLQCLLRFFCIAEQENHHSYTALFLAAIQQNMLSMYTTYYYGKVAAYLVRIEKGKIHSKDVHST